MILRDDWRARFRIYEGDILLDRSDIVVCPVNCVPGVMGKGLAKRFAEVFPTLKADHQFACRTSGLRIGCPRLAVGLEKRHPGTSMKTQDVLQFPTKAHWRDASRYQWIFVGLANLYGILGRYQPDSEHVVIAFPALGCGLGGLEFEVVSMMLSAWAFGLPERFTVNLYVSHEGNK